RSADLVVGLGGYGDGVHAALAHQGVEDAAVFVLVGAVPGDLGGKNALVLGDQGGDAGVLPAALRLAARGDRAEQGERFVVVEDLLEQTPGRKHRDHLFRGLAGEESNAGARPGQQVCRTTAPNGGRTGTTRT